MYELGSMVVQKYIDSQQGLIMQSINNPLNTTKNLYKRLLKHHLSLSVIIFLLSISLGKWFLYIWLNITVENKVIYLLSILTLMKNIKLFQNTFLFCLTNKFCELLTKINFCELIFLYAMVLLTNPSSTYDFYSIYFLPLLLSILLLIFYSKKIFAGELKNYLNS